MTNTTAQLAKKMSLTVKANAALQTIRVSALVDGMVVKYNHHKSVGVYTVLLVAKNEDNRNYTLILMPMDVDGNDMEGVSPEFYANMEGHYSLKLV